MTLPQAMFFDWDGTLVDSYGFLEAAHNDVKRQLGLPALQKDEYREFFGKPREYLYEKMYGEHALEAWRLFDIYVEANHATALPVMDRAAELLESLRGMDVVCGVVTNKRPSLVNREVEFFGWADHFVSVVGAGEAEEDKPSSAPLRLALSQAGGFHKDDIWFVGDTEADAACAKNFGCDFILIHENYEDLEWVNDFAPLYQFRSCVEMHDFVLQSGGKSLKQVEN